MSAVRLWRQGDSELWRLFGKQSPLPQDAEYLALPAAQHAALVALLGECRDSLREGLYGECLRDRATCDCPRAVVDRLSPRLDAALAGLGGA